MLNRWRTVLAAVAVGLVLTATACGDDGADDPGAAGNPGDTPAAPQDVTLVVGQAGQYVRNFNPFAPGAIDPTRALIYEPLWIVSTAARGEEYPWLATDYEWSEDLRTLTFTIRDDVLWSDGEPMTVDDVSFTLSAGRDNIAFNQANLWGPTGIAESVAKVGDKQVSITFKNVDTMVFGRLVNSLYIVPEHVFGTLDDPASFANEEPVGTGPFTEIKSFSSQSIDFGRNEHYWQQDKPAFETLRYMDNTNAVLDLQAGTHDWNGAFVPDVQAAYDDRDPDFHHYYATASPPVVLFLNLAKPPFDDAAFRHALSMAIDRDAVVTGAEFGDALAADATGLNGLFPDWVNDDVSAESVTFDVDAAAAAMEDAGYARDGDRLVDPDGKPVAIELLTNSDFPDYVAAAEMIARTWGELGIDVTLRPAPFGDWYGSLSNGTFDAGISYTFSGTSPVDFYDQLLGGQHATPAGQPAGANNYSRYANPELDALISEAKTTADVDEQAELVDEMQEIVAADLPVIPVFVPPVFYQYNTSRFTGWPTEDDYYAAGPPSALPDRLVVITTIEPK